MSTTKTTTKAAPAKLAPIEQGKCRRIVNGKRCLKPVPAEHPNWTWDADCVKAHRAAQKAARAKSAPKSTKAAAKTPVRKPARAPKPTEKTPAIADATNVPAAQ